MKPNEEYAQTNESALLSTALFRRVDSSAAKELAPLLRSQSFMKGQAIFHEGDTDQRLVILDRGRVKLIRVSRDDRVQLLSIHTHGEILGEIPVFDPSGGPRTASAIAMTNDTQVVWINHEELFEWLNAHPHAAVDMLQVLARRMRTNNEHLSDLVFMDVPGRLAKTLINLAFRFGEPGEEGIKVSHNLTQEELAQLVGSSRETVNKALMEFTARGWISRHGRSVIIYQPGMLIRRSRR